MFFKIKVICVVFSLSFSSLLYSMGDDGSLLAKAVNDNKAEIVKMILRGGTQINYQDKDGNTPLIIALKKRKQQ